MKFNQTNSPMSLKNSKRRGKNRHTLSQRSKVYQYLLNNVSTASMISHALEIPHKNVTRYKRKLENQGLLFEVEQQLCAITGFKAWYITCNTKLIKK